MPKSKTKKPTPKPNEKQFARDKVFICEYRPVGIVNYMEATSGIGDGPSHVVIFNAVLETPHGTTLAKDCKLPFPPEIAHLMNHGTTLKIRVELFD